MTIKKTVLSATNTLINWTLMAGVIASVGLLSFCGMWVITPSIPLAAAAFILAGFVEGEVFKRNIFDGMKDLRLLTKKGLNKQIAQTLDAHLNPKTFVPENASPFLAMYYQQRKLIAGFEDKHLTAAQKHQRKKALLRLKYMQQSFIDHVTGNPTLSDELIGDDFKTLVEKTKASLPAMQKRIRMLRVGLLLSVISGVAFGLATASSLAMMGGALAFSLSTVVLPLSVIAGIGYVFLIFHTTKELLFTETVSKWRDRISKWFKRREYTDEKTKEKTQEGIWHYRFRTIATGLLVALALSAAVCATLASAGTYWYAVREGAELIPAIARAARTITAIIVPVSALTTLAFSFRNSLESVKYMVKQSRNAQPMKWAKQKFGYIFESKPGENSWQAFNPFRILARIISLPYTLCIFLGHAISMGLSGDRTPGMEIPSLVAGTVNDSMTDMHYLFEDGHHHAQPKLHKPNDEGHHHGTIPDYFLKVIISPLLLGAACWSYGFSRFNRTSPTFSSALKDSFGVHHHHHYQSKVDPDALVTTTWKIAEVTQRFRKERERLKATTINSKVADLKIVELDKAEKQIKSGLECGKVKPLAIDRKALNTFRMFSTESKTQTTRFIEKIERDFVASPMTS